MKYGIYNLIIFTLPIHRYGSDVGFTLKPYLIISIPLILSYLIELPFSKRDKKKGSIDKPILFGIIVFLFFILLSTIINGYHIKSIRHFLLVVWGLIIVYIFLKKTNDLKKFQRAMDAFIFAGFLFAISGIYMYLSFLVNPGATPLFDPSLNGIYITTYYKFGRLCGFEKDPNAYALTLLPFLALSVSTFLWYRYKKMKKKTLWAGVVSILLFINLLLTFSRGGYITFIIMLISLWILTSYKKNFIGKLFKSFLAILLLSILILTSFYCLDIFKGETVSELNEVLFTRRMNVERSRLILWRADLEIFRSNILWGVGQGVVREEMYKVMGRKKQVHNTYLELLSENGIFAGICFLAVIFLIVRKALLFIHDLKREKFYYNFVGIFSGFLGILIAMIFLSYLTQIIFWFQMGLMLICFNLIEKSREFDRLETNNPKAEVDVERNY